MTHTTLSLYEYIKISMGGAAFKPDEHRQKTRSSDFEVMEKICRGCRTVVKCTTPNKEGVGSSPNGCRAFSFLDFFPTSLVECP